MDVQLRNLLLLDTVKPSTLFLPLAVDRTDEFAERPLFYLDDGFVGFGFHCTPRAGMTDSEMKRFSGIFTESLPIDTIVQIQMFASPDIFDITRKFRDIHFHPNPLLNAIANRRQEFLETASNKMIDKHSRTRFRDLKLNIFIKLQAPNYPLKKDDRLYLTELYDRVYETLKTTGLRPQSIDAEYLCKYMQTILNWDEDATWRFENNQSAYDPKRYIRESFFDLGNRIAKPNAKSLMLGEKHVAVMSIKDFPRTHCIFDLVKLIGDVYHGNDGGITENFMICTNVLIVDPEKTKSDMESKRQKNNYQANSQITRYIPKYLEIKQDFDALFQLLEDGDRLVKASFSIILFGNDEQHIAGVTSSMRSYWKGFDYDLIRETYCALPVFLNCMAFNAEINMVRELYRYRTMTAKQASHFCPIIAEWKGDQVPAILLSTRLGQPFCVDLYSGTSYSAVIIAETGKGKSVLTNNILQSYMCMPNEGMYPKAWVIDIGESYKGTCNISGGNYVDFGDDSLRISPFASVTDANYGESEPMLIGILSVMAAPNEGLSDFQARAVGQVLRKVYAEKRNKMTVDDICEGLLAFEPPSPELRPEIVRLVTQLDPYTTNGTYGHFFKGEPNIDLHSKQLTVLELQSLKSRADLQKVVLYIMMYTISQEMAKMPRNHKKFIILDEAWQLLSASEQVAKFMESVYRTIRKAKGSALICTQGISDLYANASSRAIAENSPNKLMLYQDPSSIRRAMKENMISLDESAFAIMESVDTKVGYYSEIFVQKSTSWGVARLVADKFSQLVTTTEGNERETLNRLEGIGFSAADAILEYIKHDEAGTLQNLKSSLPAIQR